MRILVTGGAGFIGSNVVDAYCARGHEVAVLDDLSTGLRENLNPEARFYQADIRDADAVARVLSDFRPQVVNHHAAQIDVRRSARDPVFDAQTNILGSLNLLRAAIAGQVERVIYASTGGAIYGEPDYLPVDEAHPPRPLSEYGVSKHAVEHYLFTYGVNHGLSYVALRYGNVYGPRQNPYGEAGVIAIFTGKMLACEPATIFGDGEAVRDYVYVGDVVRANELALSRGERVIVNVGTGVGTSVNDLYRMLAEATGCARRPRYAPVRPGELKVVYLSARLAGEVLDWAPQVPIGEGIRRTVAFQRARE